MKHNYTEEEKIQLRNNLLVPCTSREMFQAWLNIYLNVDLADCTVSRFSSTNPLDAAYYLYDYAINNVSEEPLKIMFVASRGSQKTLLASCVEMAVMLHDRRSVLHFAAIKEQSRVGYDYLKKFAQMPFIVDLLSTKPTVDELKFSIPNYLNSEEDPIDVNAKVLSISEGQVQGQHYSMVSVDELLVLQFSKRKAYYDIPGVLSSDYRTGKPSIMIEVSSRKGAYSLVEDKIASAPRTGLMVKSWTVLELTKPCPDSRSGTEPVIYHSNPKLGIIQDENQFKDLSDAEKMGFIKVNGFKGCLTCPIAPVCCTDLKKQTSKSKALRAIQSVISEYKANSLEWVLSQLFSMQPSSEGLIYSKFSRERHVKTYKEFWELITGEKRQQKPTIHQIVSEMKKRGYRIFAGLDHTGGNAPAAINILALDSLGRIFILETYSESKKDIEDLAVELTRLKTLYEFEKIYADPAAADKNDWLRKKKKFRVIDSFDRSIESGIEIIRSKLMAASGDISIYLLDDRTSAMQDEFGKYHYRELSDGTYGTEPEDEHNHAQDALRYILVNLFAKTGHILAPDISPEEKKMMQQDQMNGMSMTDWIQWQMHEAARKNAEETGKDPENVISDEIKVLF